MMQFSFTPFPNLQTERLVLRQVLLTDAPEIFVLRSDERVLKYIGREPAQSLLEAEEHIERITNFLKNNESILWGIALKEDPSILIGTICYWRLQPSNYRAEIGYALHPDHWRKGIMREAIEKVLDFGYNEMKLHSVEGRISPGNLASAAILEVTGFVREGYLKEEFCFRGEFIDSVIYSRLQ